MPSGHAPKEPSPDLVPGGLIRCKDCGELVGVGLAPDDRDGVTVQRVVISCLCNGLICGNCGRERIHRPISDYYNEEDGKIWHVPRFASQRDCRLCGARDWQSRDGASLTPCTPRQGWR